MGQGSYVKFVVIFVVLLALGVGGYFIFRSENPYEQAERALEQYEEAMRADTYGGKTPQETLDLFIAALRADDVELASKYFLLDENLSRQQWVDYLSSIRDRGLLNKMANDISTKAQPGDHNSDIEFGYVLYNNDGTVGVQISLRLNRYTTKWKIESL